MFLNKLNKYNNTGTHMLGSINCMPFKITLNHIFGLESI